MTPFPFFLYPLLSFPLPYRYQIDCLAYSIGKLNSTFPPLCSFFLYRFPPAYLPSLFGHPIFVTYWRVFNVEPASHRTGSLFFPLSLHFPIPPHFFPPNHDFISFGRVEAFFHFFTFFLFSRTFFLIPPALSLSLHPLQVVCHLTSDLGTLLFLFLSPHRAISFSTFSRPLFLLTSVFFFF